MLINGKNEVFMIDRDNTIFHIANLEFPFRKDPRVHLANTLLDGVSEYCSCFWIVMYCAMLASLDAPLSPCHTVPKLTPDGHTIKEMFKFGSDRNNIGPFVRAS